MNSAANHRSPVERYRGGVEVPWNEIETFLDKSQIHRIIWEDAGRPEDFDFQEWIETMTDRTVLIRTTRH